MKGGDKQVIADAVRIGNYQKNEVPQSAEEFAQRLLHTVYMGTENRFVQQISLPLKFVSLRFVCQDAFFFLVPPPTPKVI